jgi:Delta6-protoilludene synthase
MVFRRFWLRAMQVSSPSAQERFVASFAEYAYAVIDEASDRAKGSVRKLTDYLCLTRLTAGPYPCFFPIEMDLDISDEVMTHPSMEMLRGLTAESLVLGNVSYAFSHLATIKCLTEGDRIYTPTTASRQPDTAVITLLLLS